MTDETRDALARLEAELAEIKRQLAEELRRDEARREAFDRLYEEMRQYKEDFVFQAEKPLLLDLLLFYDSLNWFKDSLVDRQMSPDVVADSFQFLLDEFTELLYRRDVLPLDPRPVFDREVHKAVKLVPTDDPRQDWTVERVLKRGFTRGGRLLRAEEVAVRRHRKPARDEG